MNKQNKIRTLLVCANPRGTDPLRTDREERVLKESIQLSDYRELIDVDVLKAATIDDLRRALLRSNYSYNIVHFSGHGTRHGLLFEDDNGRIAVPRTDALARLLAKHNVETAILNACYSLDIGETALIGTKYTIVMDGPIDDRAAIEFSRGFYDGIGAGKNILKSFKEGIDCVELKNLIISAVLLPDGLRYPTPEHLEQTKQEKLTVTDNSVGVSEQRRLLLGIALDVSGSMKESINSGRINEARSRLESAKEAISRMGSTINNALKDKRTQKVVEYENRVKTFAYCFGTRIEPGYDDLFGIMLAVREVDVEKEVEKRKRQYENEARERYSGYEDLESIASSFFGRNTVQRFAGSIRADAERSIRNRITSEIAHLLRERASKIDDTLLTLDKFSQLFDEKEGTNLEDFESLIYGSTPLRATMAKIVSRFSIITTPKNVDDIRSLLVISDGQPTDGDPSPYFEKLKETGVLVISCYVTSKDIADPRILLGTADENWPSGAKLMFDVASQLDESSEFAGYLLRHGWTIERNAKMFVQINHSDVLEEFVSAVGSPVVDEDELGLLPIGN